MAEILGLVASIVAVIQLTNMVTETAKKHMNTVKGAQSVLVPLLGKLRSLGSILTALQGRGLRGASVSTALTRAPKNLRRRLNEHKGKT